ncbi:MAG: penicillin-binding transpeptidase domain-containing protein [Microbacterium sp.]
MTKEVRRLALVMLAMFFALLLSVSWIQVVNADTLAENPYNTRTRLDSYQIQRGSIIVDGTAIASSSPTNDKYRYQRSYVDAAMWAPVTGYYNPVLGASTRIENALNTDLSGVGSTGLIGELEQIFTGRPPQGMSVELSLNAAAQKAAWDALTEQGLQGAVVAVEPSTGRILVNVSTPSFDTNTLAAHDADGVNAAFDVLDADPSKPMLNRGFDEIYPPGSTFKLVVAAAALSSGDYTMASTFPNPARLPLAGTDVVVSNAWGGSCGPGATTTLAEAIRLSCNIPMAELAMKLGPKKIREAAEKFGFNGSFETPLGTATSSYPKVVDEAQTAMSGFGQQVVTASPLQMALVAAGIGNGGMVMNPHMVDAVIGDDFADHRQYENTELGRAVDPKVAAAITDAMVASVNSQDGAATGARIDGIDVAGKTGTAEMGGRRPYTLWFTGFAPAEDPRVAVAVVVENGGGMGQSGSGDEIAAPIAKRVIEAVLGR